MITNERQYKISKAEVEKFKEALNRFNDEAKSAIDIHPEILEAQRQALEFKRDQLINAIQEYVELKEGKTIVSLVNSLNELPLALIKARIANGLTQAELATKLGMQEQQIQRYEGNRYDAASLKTLIKVAEILGVTIQADIQLKELDSPDELNIKNYPFKQMLQRNWFTISANEINEAVRQSAELLSAFYTRAGISNLRVALNKRSIRSNSVLNEFALNAWYARILIKARDQNLETFFDKSFISQEWIKELSMLSQEIQGPRKAIEKIKSVGIRVVIESHLDGTHLDGAAFLLDEVFPVIALTLRYDRLDNFWFVLFHELAHVVLHLRKDVNEAIFDDLDSTMEGIEKEADQFALDAMIPNDVWKKSLVRFSPSNVMIIQQAKKLNVHPALVAGRIRRESGQYFQFSDLVGQGEVRTQFIEELK